MRKSPLISIVVLNWNGKKFVDRFMESVLKQSYPATSIELVFTDNLSSDDSVEYAQEKYGEKVNFRLVQNDKNYGYSKGNNLGIKQATGDYILICNQDLELDKDLVKNLVESASETSAAITVPKLMYLNKPGVINNAGSRLEPRSDWPVYEIGANEKDTGQHDERREITAFCGACVLITREFLEKVGLFDNRFFMYFEDGDLSWRGQKAGYKYIYEPTAVALHVHAGSSKEGSPLFNHFVGRNRLLILAKNASFIVWAKGWAKTLYWQFIFRVKNLLASLRGRYSKSVAWNEFWLSQKMLWAAALLTPYALLKRFRILKEEHL